MYSHIHKVSALDLLKEKKQYRITKSLPSASNIAWEWKKCCLVEKIRYLFLLTRNVGRSV